MCENDLLVPASSDILLDFLDPEVNPNLANGQSIRKNMQAYYAQQSAERKGKDQREYFEQFYPRALSPEIDI